MKKILVGSAVLLFSTLASAQFSASYQQDQSGISVFATNTDKQAHTCNISYRFFTENSPGGQNINTSATARPGLNNQVIHSTRGGWSQFRAENVQINCD